MTGRRLFLRFLLRIHRFCLHTYPSWFRAAHGGAMIGTFEDLVTVTYERTGTFGVIRVAIAEFGSLLFRGMRERFSRPSPPPDRQPLSNGRRQHEINFRERNRMYTTNNFRYAFRSLVRTPGYTAAFVLTLGLGIGANTAIFSVINGVLLRPLPYPDADRIMYLEQVAAAGGTTNTSLSFVEVADYRTEATTLEEVVEFGDWTFNVLGRGEPHLTIAGLVTANFFQVLGLRPHLGRTLTEDDDSRAS